MKRDLKDDHYALCDDLLAPEGYGEIIGGSQREDDYDILLARIKNINCLLRLLIGIWICENTVQCRTAVLGWIGKIGWMVAEESISGRLFRSRMIERIRP